MMLVVATTAVALQPAPTVLLNHSRHWILEAAVEVAFSTLFIALLWTGHPFLRWMTAGYLVIVSANPLANGLFLRISWYSIIHGVYGLLCLGSALGLLLLPSVRRFLEERENVRLGIPTAE
jgi:hypothetical protein